MTRSDLLAATFAFGHFELDWRSRELRKRGERQRVPQQPLHVLDGADSPEASDHAATS